MDRELSELIEAAERGDAGVSPVARPGPCRVWRIDGAEPRWLKRFASHRAWAQERDALTDWAPLPGRTPQVLAQDRAARVLLLSHVAGTEGDGVEAWRAAGRFLRGMQDGGGPDPDPMPLTEALDRRFSNWIRQAEPWLDPATRSAARAAWTPDPFAGARRTRCHRDFQPRNWLWDGATLGVIDFEHARMDHPWVDCVKLLDCVDRDDPRWGAFFEGAQEPSGPAFDGLRLLHALGSVVWGAREGDEAFEEQGRRLLEVLLR